MNTLSLRTGYAVFSLVVLAGLQVAGCGSDQPAANSGDFVGCSGDPLAETYSAGMTTTGKSGKLNGELVSSDPGPPIKGTNSWTVLVKDGTGAPVDGATIQVFPFMPYHNHGTQVVPTVTPMGSGTYVIAPLYFFMAGIWQTTLTISTADSTNDDSLVFSFCVGD